MALINQATKELQVKVVYYGPAMGGKTTNLVQVHDHVQTAAGNKGKLVSLATSSDRTLFFDFLPIEAMSIKGFKTKFQLYTVPGQVIYNTTRQLVLRGVDGIVFVADSQYEKMAENVESIANLEDNLKSLRLNFTDIPYVLRAMMFYEASGGRRYTGMANAYQGFVDLSTLLKADRAILVAQGPAAGREHQGAQLLRDGQPLMSSQDRHVTIYRFVFPVKKS